MIPLFFSMLVDTVEIDPFYETVRVHEWGVIQLDYGYYEAVGAEWCYPDDHGRFQYGDLMVVDAPVVWFHGPGFTGDFTVTILNGNLTQRYPEPDVIETIHSPFGTGYPAERVVWEDLSFTLPVSDSEDDKFVDRISSMDGLENFSWAAPWWRDVPSLTVTRESDGWSDQFIYYECTTGDVQTTDESILPQYGWAGNYIGQALVFEWDYTDNVLTVRSVDVEDMQVMVTAGESGFRPVTADAVEQTLCRWAASNLKSEEIEALWLTWEPIIRGRCELYGERVLLFPLPDEVVESISTLQLETDQGYFVEYHRLFLGLTRG